MKVRKTTRIQDSIHGIVELSPIERLAIDSLAFQRLLNVKQLGMAYAVFPGADYSRFSHCIGVSSIMARWLDTLASAGTAVDEPKRRLYRLAALLHDIGHYPFSHTLEHAVKAYYSNKSSQEGSLSKNYLDHEEIGKHIVAGNPELTDALIEIGLNLQTLQNIFGRTDSTRLDPLLSSDLDADRIDYLRRTAHHTGLPYGRIDSQYLITEIRLDDLGRPCWTERALRAVDQLLLARFFDYQQVVFNKTVIALELVLERLVFALLDTPEADGGGLDLSKSAVEAKLKDGTWNSFDDHDLFQRIKTLREGTSSSSTKSLCDCLLQRNPPRQLCLVEFSGPSTLRRKFSAFAEAVKSCITKWSNSSGIDAEKWFVWARDFKFVKYEHDEEVGTDDPLYTEMPRIQLENGTSIPLVKHRASLIRPHYLNRLYSLRVYAVFDAVESQSERRRTLANEVRSEIELMRHSFMEGTTQTTIFDIA